MEEWLIMLIVIVCGFLGGIVRSLVGVVKHGVLLKKEKFKPRYFFLTIIISGIIGVFTSILVANDYRLALLAGYAGSDILEGLYKAQKLKIATIKH